MPLPKFLLSFIQVLETICCDLAFLKATTHSLVCQCYEIDFYSTIDAYYDYQIVWMMI
jgi:hypothetical protein